MLLAAADNQPMVDGSSSTETATFYGAPPPRYAPPVAMAIPAPHVITTTGEAATAPAPEQYVPPGGAPSIGYGYTPTPRMIPLVSDVQSPAPAPIPALPTVTVTGTMLPNHWQFIVGGALLIVLVALYVRSRR